MKTFADRLETALKNKGWSQNRLEREAGLSKGHVNRLIHGKGARTAPDTLAAIARVLGVSFDWLATGADVPAQTDEDELDSIFKPPSIPMGKLKGTRKMLSLVSRRPSFTSNLNSFNERLETVMASRGYSLADLEDFLGLQKGQGEQVLDGAIAVDPDKIEALSEILLVKSAWLTTGIGDIWMPAKESIPVSVVLMLFSKVIPQRPNNPGAYKKPFSRMVRAMNPDTFSSLLYIRSAMETLPENERKKSFKKLNEITSKLIPFDKEEELLEEDYRRLRFEEHTFDARERFLKNKMQELEQKQQIVAEEIDNECAKIAKDMHDSVSKPKNP